MKRKRRGWILGLSALGIVSAGATGAYFSDQIAVVNEIRMGDVDISLEEFSLKDGKEVPYEDPKLVQPGDIVSKIPRITNLAEPCWIRVKVGYRNDKEELEGFRDENLSGISAKWVRRGEYYYYTSVLEPSEAVDIFHNLQVPAYWDNDHAGQNLDVIVDAQAIQAVHFQPDFEAMSPWGNQEVEVCIHKESDRVERKQEIIAHKVEFNGAAHKLISVSDDFFSNFGTVMPGDTLWDTVILDNTTSRPATILFHTEGLNLTEEQKMLLDQLTLQLKLNGTVLYNGKLEAETLHGEHELIRLEPDQGGTLEFTVSVPKELKNAYALRDTAVKWVFKVEEESPSPMPTEKPEEPGQEQPGNGQTQTGGLYGTSPVKTGDEAAGKLPGLFMELLLSVAAAGTVWYKGAKKR